MGEATGSSPEVSGGGAPRDFEIVVCDPVKQGEGVSAFVSYKVCAAAAPGHGWDLGMQPAATGRCRIGGVMAS